MREEFLNQGLNLCLIVIIYTSALTRLTLCSLITIKHGNIFGAIEGWVESHLAIGFLSPTTVEETNSVRVLLTSDVSQEGLQVDGSTHAIDALKTTSGGLSTASQLSVTLKVKEDETVAVF